MSKEPTIEEMNVVIAAFEGRKFYGHTIDKFGGDTGNELPEMKYDTSWGWLMPVVEKIGDISVKSTASYNQDLRFRVEIVNGYTKIEGTRERIFFNSSIEGSMLMATYKAVYKFITWYNLLN